MQNGDGCTLWIEFNKMDGREWRMDKLWNQKGSLNLPMWSWLDLRSASEGSESRAGVVATSMSLVGQRVS